MGKCELAYVFPLIIQQYYAIKCVRKEGSTTKDGSPVVGGD